MVVGQQYRNVINAQREKICCCRKVYQNLKEQNLQIHYFRTWTYVISDLNGEETAETFCKKELQKAGQKDIRAEKLKRGKVKIICQMERL